MSRMWVAKSQNVILDHGAPRPASLLIEGEKIKQIAEHKESFGLSDIEDFGILTLSPGFVDTHAHINEPGRTDWEGFETATRAAAAGGITTVIDMPLNSIPATTSLKSFQVKREAAKGKCSIDYGFWGGVIPGNSEELEPMVKAGIMGFKCFLCPSGVDEFPHVTEEDLDIAMPILARLNVPLLVHAELEAPVAKHFGDVSDYKTYLASRPASWEVNAIRMVLELSQKHRTRIHIVHLGAAEALPDIEKAQSKGIPVTAETCPHYLLFEAEKISKGATHFKCAPPIRDRKNREGLWQGVKDGQIEFLVSDHSPCTPSLKKMETGDFEKAWGGISGLQFSASAIWTEMSRRGFTISDHHRLMSKNTAKFLGVSRKGQLTVGADADLVVWDPSTEFSVEKSLIQHRHKVCPYEGQKLKGQVHATFVRGKLVYINGSFSETPLGREVLRGS